MMFIISTKQIISIKFKSFIAATKRLGSSVYAIKKKKKTVYRTIDRYKDCPLILNIKTVMIRQSFL